MTLFLGFLYHLLDMRDLRPPVHLHCLDMFRKHRFRIGKEIYIDDTHLRDRIAENLQQIGECVVRRATDLLPPQIVVPLEAGKTL